MAKLFDYLNAINVTKENLLVDEQSIKEYTPFIINRGLSYYVDTVLQANEMNRYPNLPKDMANDFLRASIKKKKRFSKWVKKADSSDDLNLVCDYFNYSKEKGALALALLTESQIDTVREQMGTGGKQKHGKV
ncbi:MAG: DNA polymerase clamp loader subunit A [Candidatus Roizmanbacteria bacterium]|jgi:hypothetical protein|nr:DNA polymerase clamp loader subunit A [Candidatus Roizmanbacteria bacterium]